MFVFDTADLIRAGNLARAMRDSDADTWNLTLADQMDGEGASPYATFCAMVALVNVMTTSVSDLTDDDAHSVIGSHVSALADVFGGGDDE